MSRIWRRLAALSACAALLLSGCVSVNYQVGREYVQGRGDMENLEYDVAQFDRINIAGDFVATYTEGDTCKVEAEAPQDYLPHILVSVQNGQLLVDCDMAIAITNNKAPRIHITAPTLTEIVVSGAAAVDEADTLKGESLSIKVSGASALELPVEVTNLRISNSGTAMIELSGSADSAEFQLSGTGAIEADKLQTKTARVDIHGMGLCTIRCSEELEVNISGMGSLEYYGTPSVRQSISGMGTVERLG